MENYLKNFKKLGYVKFDNVLDKKSLNVFYDALLNLSYYHLKKAKDHQEKVKNIYKSGMSAGKKISKMFEIFEKNDPEILYQLQKMLMVHNDLRNILINQKLNNIFKKLLDIKGKTPILMNGPGIFVNRPKTKRLLYRWHSEQHYYPKRRNFINIWFPIFSSKSEKNGTMFVKEKSHLLNDLPFNEYQGFNKQTESKKNHFVQYEIPENFVKNYKTYKAKLNVGDLLVFHRKAVHTSTENKSKDYSFAVVFRIWDMSKDLTINGNLSVFSYKDSNNGRPNLIVDTD